MLGKGCLKKRWVFLGDDTQGKAITIEIGVNIISYIQHHPEKDRVWPMVVFVRDVFGDVVSKFHLLFRDGYSFGF